MSNSGAPGIGGEQATGGESSVQDTGGTQAIGATGGSANSSSGGADATGGSSSPATGGEQATGGARATGGSSNPSTGGAKGTGGASSPATGGAKATGGASSPATGGAKATGGVSSPSTGGAKATGGASSVAAPTWSQLYTNYFGPNTAGNCVSTGCHSGGVSPIFNSATTMCSALKSYFGGTISFSSILTWMGKGGNMPANGAAAPANAVADITAWQNAGAVCP
jgi:hypothetical protein